ncbi:hypothetical protein [Pararhodobacter sp.]|uniref:hypothetical protein n=1 Tax=Pararhodobacter sp. TaxID=2127056 RepID=UPI002AFF5C14|nr:hypothetical protein [Pararhodobacter sp.]
MHRSILILALLAGSANAQTALQASDFHGDWTDGDPSACVVGRGDVENFAFRIANGTLYSVESSCVMENPVAVRGMQAVLFDMNCHGEGDTWTDRALFMHDRLEGRLIFLSDGIARILTRCTN